MTYKVVSAVAALGLLATVTSANAGLFEEYSRKNIHPGEFYGYFHTMDGDTDFDGTIITDKGNVFGIGFGINMSDYLNLNTELGIAKLDTTSSLGGSADTDMFEWKVGLDYNILKYRLTPIVTGGFGVMSQSGSVGDVDWQETTFTYGVGAGVRWDISDRFVLKAVYRFDWTNFEGSAGATRYDSVWVSIGYKF